VSSDALYQFTKPSVSVATIKNAQSRRHASTIQRSGRLSNLPTIPSLVEICHVVCAPLHTEDRSVQQLVWCEPGLTPVLSGPLKAGDMCSGMQSGRGVGTLNSITMLIEQGKLSAVTHGKN
jgi:hypothetical protein